VKSAEALETLEKVTTLVVDKTGTLTLGKPALTELIPLGEQSADQVLALAAAAESSSEHPYAMAIVAAAKEKSLAIGKFSKFSSLTGKGVRATIDGAEISVGRSTLRSIPLATGQLAKASSLEEQGRSVMFVFSNNSLIGLIGVSGLPPFS
jgi:Cu+-exporting ATPase